mgnify:CR=1 FL=1
MDTKKVQNVVVNKSVISTAGLITLLLMILKLTNNIEISWLWVFAPYWLPIAIVFGFIGLFMLGALIVGVIMISWEEYENHKDKKRRLENKKGL